MIGMNVEASDAAFPLLLSVDNDGGVTGLSPTVAVRIMASGTPLYLDWSGLTFKTSGWTTKYQVMLEIERGNYQWLLNVAALSLSVGTKLSVEYHVDNGMGLVGDDSDILVITQANAQLSLLVAGLLNRLEEAPGNPGTLTLYADDGLTPLKTWQLRDSGGGPVLATTGTPARRSAGV